MLKKAQVIMLPTENNAVKGDILLRTYANDLKIHSGSLFDIEGGYCKPQHLYIISDDEIKEGDWFISTEFDIVGQLQKGEKITTEKVKKIIATTDTSLNKKHDCDCGATTYEGCSQCLEVLPQPSQQFIEQYIESYNKGEIITDVLVEYELSYEASKIIEHHINKIPKLKVDKNNTITIKKVKDSWNREEVIILIKSFEKDIKAARSLYDNQGLDKWIEQNL